ncbi:MAG: PEP-utilizing enzyme [Chloroflexi bacterium]|nr:PEP-utilizing enzyme [Chloroflexota bacterium]
MTHKYIVPLSEPQATLAAVGGKGASLAKLSAAGLPVPNGFNVTTDAYWKFVSENNLQVVIRQALAAIDPSQPASLEAASSSIREGFLAAQIPPDIANEVVNAYAELPGQNPAVAVRSSATAEDLPEASFAGQQETYLNVNGPAAVLEATQKCWASLWTARAIGYRARQGIDPDQVALGVVVQLLVPAEAAGILFTANPVNGNHDQVVINAAWGLGEAVVGGMVTPDTLIVDKANGHILEHKIADKQVMTVRVNGGTQEQPVPESLKQVLVLDHEAAAELSQYAIQIENLYDRPMDIEWALADGKLYIVQARPITAMPAPQAPEAIEWHLPDPKGQYIRASIVELLPDPLSPLFSTLGMGAIEEGIDTLMQDLFNMPAGVLKDFMLTIDGYAYQRMSFTRYQWWMMLSRMGPRIPRMLREGVSYWQNVTHPRYVEAAARWGEQSIARLTPGELLAGIDELMDAFAHHLASLMASTMGPSAGSEGLFTKVYEKTALRPSDPSAPTFLMGFDSIPIKAEKALYDLAQWCKGREALATHLINARTEEIASQLDRAEPPEDVSVEDWLEWQTRFREYLNHYGYSIYDMDFSKPLPMDDPGPLLENLKLFISGEGKNPYERQQAYAQRREEAVASTRARLRGIKRWAFEKALKWAQSQAPLREDGIAEIGLAYPALRRMLRELGSRFVEAGAIEQPDDIYWLEAAEVKSAVVSLERGESLERKAGTIQERKALWQMRKRLSPPPQLPPGKKLMGVDVEGILAMSSDSPQGNTIRGVAASPGQVTGIACVLHGPDDFDQMQAGGILVASITTPAWTPLFALASGIVTDIGGPLSHGSIVAREYGIPAVLGTGVATRYIHSGQRVTVDGNSGVVTLQ